MVRNLRTENEKTPNEGFDPNENWILAKRFLMIDTISGLEVGKSTTDPKYVRFARDVRLKIMMDTEIKEQIYRPLLIVDYVEVDSDSLSASAKFNVFYSVNYFSDYNQFMGKVFVAFWLILIFAIFVTTIRFYAYTKRNPQSKFGIKSWPIKIIEYFFDYLSEFMFWLIFIVCAIIFISFKLGVYATKLLPEEGQAS